MGLKFRLELFWPSSLSRILYRRDRHGRWIRRLLSATYTTSDFVARNYYSGPYSQSLALQGYSVLGARAILTAVYGSCVALKVKLGGIEAVSLLWHILCESRRSFRLATPAAVASFPSSAPFRSARRPTSFRPENQKKVTYAILSSHGVHF